MFEWVPRTLSGSLAHVGGAHGVDLAGLALGQVLVLSKKVHCMSLSSIRILYYHTPTERLKPNPEPWYGFTYFPLPAGSISALLLGPLLLGWWRGLDRLARRASR